MKYFLVLLTSISSLAILDAQLLSFSEYDSTPILIENRNGNLNLGDIDNDGDPDLLVLGQLEGLPKTTLYENDGTGQFTVVTGTPFVDLRIGDIAFGDVDNDGDLDVMLVGSTNLTPYHADIFLNDGSGGYTLDLGNTFTGISGSIEFMDVDNDGDLDLFMLGSERDGFTSPIPHSSFYFNDGNGNFIEETALNIPGLQFGDFEFIDIDNDNDQDLIVTGEDANNVYKNEIYANDGSGTFSLFTSNPFVVTNSGDIAVGDSDNDGDLDVIINGRDIVSNDRLTKLYTNDGNGAFSEVLGTSFLPSDLGELIFADFDNDGDQDLLMTGDLFGAFVHAADVYENLGGNNFVLAVEMSGAYIAETAVADFNGDNLLDFVVSGIAQEAPSDIFKPRTYLNQSVLFADVDVQLESFAINLYPNPTTGLFEIEGVTEDFSVKILDANGAEFQNLSSATGTISIDISTLPSGLFYISIVDTNNGLVALQKILKE